MNYTRQFLLYKQSKIKIVTKEHKTLNTKTKKKTKTYQNSVGYTLK